MLTQVREELLSEASLRREWDERGRRGIDLVMRLEKAGSHYSDLIRKIRKRRKSRRKSRNLLKTFSGGEEDRSVLIRKLERRERRLNKAVDAYLKAVQSELVSNRVEIKVKAGPAPKLGEKQTYRLSTASPDATLFVSRLITRSLREAFSLRSVGRHEIVSALISTLQGKWPKTLVRADIASFYESIDHAKLTGILDANHEVPPLVRGWVAQMLSQFEALGAHAPGRGLPRGVGPSAALAEVYLRSIDSLVRSRGECVYYGRYVDDIIAVMAITDERDAPVPSYLGEIEASLATLGLSLSKEPHKQSEVNLNDAATGAVEIEFLGYAIKHSLSDGGKVHLSLSNARIGRTIKRLNRTFEVFARSAKPHGRPARLLELRVRLLTGNSRLVNSKKDAYVGVRFSNPLLSSTKSLAQLDGILQQRLKTLRSDAPPGLRSRLGKHSFAQGWSETRFVSLSAGDWRDVVSVWRDIA